jgi:hypothetical protein
MICRVTSKNSNPNTKNIIPNTNLDVFLISNPSELAILSQFL